MKKLAFLFTLSLLFFYGCSTEDLTTTDSSIEEQNEVELRSRVIHHVSLGSNDACEALGLPPGCDANFSLAANMRADGSVSGQWQDTFPGGGEGIHVAIDCINIVGNSAIVGGYITHGTLGGVDLTGQYAITAVVDNGTSNNDTPDQMSFSFIEEVHGIPPDFCGYDIGGGFPLFDLTRGQVKIW